MQIRFGSPEAQKILEADKALREAEAKAKKGKQWYLVTYEIPIEDSCRVKAIDEGDACDYVENNIAGASAIDARLDDNQRD